MTDHIINELKRLIKEYSLTDDDVKILSAKLELFFHDYLSEYHSDLESDKIVTDEKALETILGFEMTKQLDEYEDIKKEGTE